MNDDPWGDPDLATAAERVRDVLRSGGMRPEFSQRLRAQLVAEAAARLTPEAAARLTPEAAARVAAAADTAARAVASRGAIPPAAPVVPFRRRRRPRRPVRIAVWTGSVAAAAAAAIAVVGTLPSDLRPSPVPVLASSPLSGTMNADPAGVIRLSFDQALDHASTQAALRLSPATDVRTAWDGDTLLVTPVHGLAPDSAYRLTVDARLARTATGAPLASDLQLSFGTAPMADAPGPSVEPAVLRRTVASAAAEGAEAVVTRSGALLVTAGRSGADTGLLRIAAVGAAGQRLAAGGAEQRIAAPTEAICVSRSGNSIAFLGRGPVGPGIVFASADGTPQRLVPAAVDSGSPLGWIGDDEVSFVSGGRLTAVDRQGQQRVLWPQPVDARHDIVLAPGGRYAYVGTSTGGQLIDLVGGTTRRMTNLITDPAFTADGAGIVWVDRVGGVVRAHYGAADGGTATSVRLPVNAGASLSNLAVSPDATLIVYSLTAADSTGQLRVASLTDGATLAVSTRGPGESPNFSPSGRFVTVLAGDLGSRRIETVAVPAASAAPGTSGRVAAAEAVAAAFATAQVADDVGAQGWFTRPGLALPLLPPLTRADRVWAVPGPSGVVTVRVRLTSDAQPSRPYPVQAEETVTLASPADASGRVTAAEPLPTVTSVQVGPFAPAPAGPQVLGVETLPNGAVAVTFDSDLDPSAAAAGVQLFRDDGSRVASTGSYDAANRTVLLHPMGGDLAGTPARVSVAGVLDVQGTPAVESPLEVLL